MTTNEHDHDAFPVGWACAELLRNLRARRRPDGGAWFPAGAADSSRAVYAGNNNTAPGKKATSGSRPGPMDSTFPARPRLSGSDRPEPEAMDLFEPPDTPPTLEAQPPVIPTAGLPRPALLEARQAELEMLACHARACQRCRLGATRTQAVFGTGDPDAELMFIGEGPGRDEDAQGQPFVGRAGQKLNSLIDKLGFRREDVYITNVVKSRPPENRTPLPDEIAACHPYLQRELEVVAPKVIIALGLTAAQSLLGSKETMAQLRKRTHQLGSATLIATYHPAYVLRNPKAAWDVWNDVKDVPELLRRLRG